MNHLNVYLKIDIGGKQQYIFSSNKLKEIMGASYIMESEIFGRILEKTILESGGKGIMKEYVGGGNAILSLSDREAAENFISTFSESVLKEYPGIQLEFGIAQKTGDWLMDVRNLNQDAIRNKNMLYSECRPFKFGIVQDCPLSGEGQEIYNPKVKKWISRESHQKIEASGPAYKKFESESLLHNPIFKMPDDFEDIGGEGEKNYIAVIHIDGNGLGQRFRNCKSLDDTKNLSRKIHEKLRLAMEQLFLEINGLFLTNGKFDHDLSQPDILLPKKDGKLIFPFLPIINAGDDITFICHGRLGLYLTEKYMHLLNEDADPDKKIPSCAGVAIVHTKYPFFRAYELAEKLAAEAKKSSRKATETTSGNSCWINFMIAPSGYTGNFDKTLKYKYQGLPRGPYQVIQNDGHDAEITFTDLKDQLRTMLYESPKPERWPTNKLIELRKVLTQSTSSQAYFIHQMKARGLELTRKRGLLRFPYMDLAEMNHFYPQKLL